MYPRYTRARACGNAPRILSDLGSRPRYTRARACGNVASATRAPGAAARYKTRARACGNLALTWARTGVRPAIRARACGNAVTGTVALGSAPRYTRARVWERFAASPRIWPTSRYTRARACGNTYGSHVTSRHPSPILRRTPRNSRTPLPPRLFSKPRRSSSSVNDLRAPTFSPARVA